MKYFSEITTLPTYPDLMRELDQMLADGRVSFNEHNQICINCIPGHDDIHYGTGSLNYDWSQKKTTVVNGQETISVPERTREQWVWEEDFSEVCSVFKGTGFEKVLYDLKSAYNIGRLRLMKMSPQRGTTWHHDEPNQKRFHYPLVTNPGNFMVIQDEVLHLEQNKWYLTNTSVDHAAFNASKEDRIHLVAVKLDMFDYFEKSWKPNTDKFKYSGWGLLNLIREDETVLDIGCGYNEFKSHLGDRVYGIDPANDCADERTAIEFFKTDKQWDVVLCLGSLNFGMPATVEYQVERAVELCKPGGRIFWRQNPGDQDHPWDGVENIKFFPWTMDLNYEWAKKFGCTVVECKWDSNNRIYAEWRKHEDIN